MLLLKISAVSGKNRPFSKAKFRKNMIMYLKNHGGYKQGYFIGMKYEDIRPLFERIWDQVHKFFPKDYEIEREVMKRAGFDLHDQEVEELKLYMRIISEEDITVEAIPLAIKPLMIIEYKIVNEGKINTYHITRADGSTRRYTSMINLHENINREDMETLWKLVKDKYGLVTAEEKEKKKNDVKAKSMLLVALPNEHLLTFSQYKDAKNLFEAIQVGFGGNDATKKTQKTLLKQINKPDLKTMSFNDLYNNFEIVEQEVKRTVVSSSSSGSPNMAFLSSPGTTNEVDTASIQVSVASTQVSTVNLEQIHEDDLEEIDLKWQLALLSMRARRNTSFRESDIIALNLQLEKLKKEKESNQIKIDNFENASKSLDKLIGSQITYNSKTGLGFTSYNIVAPPPTGLFAPPTIDLSSSGLEEFKQPAFESYRPKASKSVCVETSNVIKKYPDAPIIEDWVFDCDEDEPEEVVVKSENVQHKPEQVNQLNCGFHDAKMAQKLVLKTVENGSGQREVRLVWNNAMKINHQNLSNSRRNFAPTAVLSKSRIVPISTARQSSSRAIAPGKIVTRAIRKQGTNVVKSSACWVWRPFKVQDHVSKNSGSYICKRFDYVDPKGRLKSETSPFSQTIENMMKDLLLLQVVLKEMCDKKNSVLFTKTECLILSLDFKLPDENQVLLKVPTKNNMYSFDLKNVVPSKAVNELFIAIWSSGSFFTLSSQPFDQNGGLHMDCQDLGRRQGHVGEGVSEMKVIGYSRVQGIEPEEDVQAPIISFIRPFGCLVTILNTLDHLGKCDGKADEGFLVGYSINNKAFRVYNSKTKKVEENLHVNFLEYKPNVARSGPEWTRREKMSDQEYILLPVLNTSSDVPSSNKEVVSSPKDDADKKLIVEPTCVEGGKIDDLGTKRIFDDAYDDRDEGAKADYNNLETVIPVSPIPSTRIHKDNPKEQIIGEVNSTIQTRKMTKQNEAGLITFINKQRRANHKDFQNCLFACFLSQMEPKKTLVDLPHGKRAIGTKWVYKKKRDQRGIVVKNKARLVTQGHRQEEGIDYDEVFAPVAKIEAIRLFLAYASFMNFIMYQIDVKSAFLYVTIEEEVYVRQPSGFVDLEFPNRVYKVEKALYGLYQAPRAWYETLSNYLLENKFRRWTIDKTLFIKKIKDDILLVQVYVEQRKDGIFLSKEKYVSDILKKFGFSSVKSASTPMEIDKPLSKDSNGTDTKIHVYNKSAICVVKNPVYHSKTNHIEIRHHFIRDSYEKMLIEMVKIHTDSNVANLLTKAFDVTRMECNNGQVMKMGIELKGYFLNDGYANLVQHADKKELAIPWQMTTGKEFSNPLIAGSLPKTISVKNTTSSKTITSVKQIHDKVDGKVVVISESLVRSDLLFDDEDGITCLTNDKIFENLALMGYEPLSTKLTFQKGNVTPLFDTMLVQHQAPEGEGSAIPHEEGQSVHIEDSSKYERIIEEMDKDKNINLVNEQGEVQETAKHSRDDDETLAETLLNINRSLAKDKGKGIMQETELPQKLKKKEMIQLSLDEELAQKLYTK
uniref:Uncharacterized protein n=1 Tax=Tanacetum cinerariifolium TaxID=118510 RepID=A0A6L2LWR0_TANCI|nr:hypothetical protein [Tanacetum cinerariifolium]